MEYDGAAQRRAQDGDGNGFGHRDREACPELYRHLGLVEPRGFDADIVGTHDSVVAEHGFQGFAVRPAVQLHRPGDIFGCLIQRLAGGEDRKQQEQRSRKGQDDQHGDGNVHIPFAGRVPDKPSFHSVPFSHKGRESRMPGPPTGFAFLPLTAGR
ncbi:hypothetical protein SDC9_196584 [bioreactor metagenome]|uniref:Uncharacterized protein n=1 Tax=bioreactor metagenome TaxID=1076179 RepID=A0A645IC88_9ZZZZ